MRHSLLQSHVKEPDLPEEYKFVRGIIYRADTPKEVLEEVAGQHQAEQHDVMESLVADAFAFFLKKMQQKKDKLDNEFLTEEEIYGTLRTFGLVRGTEAAIRLSSSKDKAITSRETEQLQKKQV